MGRSGAPLNRLVPAAALLTAAALTVGAVLLRPEAGRQPASVGSSYRISYDVEDLTTGARSVEVVEVERPLRSRRLSGDAGSATTPEGVYDLRNGRWRQVAVVPPGEPGQDLRLTAALDWAAGQGLAVPDGTGRVAGRSCTWWLTKEPLDVAVLAPASSANRNRSCVDADGRLMADTWRAGGRDLRRRTATEVGQQASLDVFAGSSPQPLAPALAGTVVEPLSGAADDLVAARAPAGLSLRTAARFADLEPGTSQVVRRAVRAVYADEQDIVVLDQVRGSVEPRGVRAGVESLGGVFVQATGGGLVVTVPLGPDQALRVRSSLPYDELVSWLASLPRR